MTVIDLLRGEGRRPVAAEMDDQEPHDEREARVANVLHRAETLSEQLGLTIKELVEILNNEADAAANDVEDQK
jgi:hypothetical protein